MPTVFVSTRIKGNFTRLRECVLLCFVAAREHILCKTDIRKFHSRCLTGEKKHQCFLLMNVCAQRSCTPKSAASVYSLKSSITLGVFPHIASSYSEDTKPFTLVGEVRLTDSVLIVQPSWGSCLGIASESAAGLRTLQEPSEVIALIRLTTKLQ